MHNHTLVPGLFQKTGLLLIILLFCKPAFATHIVGGELNYTHIENDAYEISLTIFRDCYNANPNVFFDDTVSIGVYDPVFNFLVEDVRIPFDTLLNDTLSPVLYNDCLIIPPAVCVHTTVYKDTIDLTYNPNGYVLTYQRCCRNGTINNIVSPLETGATFSVFISPKALEINNSSPKFQSWPPIYICADFPINYDQSALDEDMDSIAYKLCTPLKGGGSPPNGNPIPQPPAPPPYEPVEWFDPPYNELNMLNAFPGDPLKIDELTGILTGTPNTIGQFVVGICLEEYRNDTLISTIRRDFQYNVGLCGNPTASFFSPEVHCSADSVYFNNQSTNSDDYLWTFDLENNPQITSSEFAPSFLYDDYGSYTVQLISEPFTICADTFSQEITILPPGMNPEIDYEIIGCGDLYEIQFNPIPNSFGSTPVDYSWVFSNGMTLDIESPLVILPSNTGFLTVTLQITGSEGCIYEATILLYINDIEETLDVDSIEICSGDTVLLNETYSLDYTYTWSPNYNISDILNPNPSFYPDSSTLYTLVVEDNLGCEKTLEVFVGVNETPSFNLPDTLIICTDSVNLEAEPFPFGYIWTADPEKNDTLGINQSINIQVEDYTTVYVHSYDVEANCNISHELTIINQQITQLENISDQLICLGDIITVELNPVASNYDIVTWNTSSTIVFSQDNNMLEYSSINPGWDTLSVSLENNFGCQLSDTFAVYLFEQIDYPVYSLNDCGDLYQEFIPAISAQEVLSWNFGDDNEVYNFPPGQQIGHSYSTAGNYLASYWIPGLEACADTIYIPVAIEESVNAFGIDYNILSCESVLELQLEAIFESTAFELDSAIWVIDESSYLGNTIDVNIDQETDIILSLFYNDGCVIELEELINWEAPLISDKDTISICTGDSLLLNFSGTNNQSVEWLPNGIFEGSTQDTITIVPESNLLVIAAISSVVGNSTCIHYDSVYVEVLEPSTPILVYDKIDCANSLFEINLENQDEFNVINWYTDGLSFENQDTLLLSVESSETTVLVESVDLNNCISEDSLNLGLYLLENKDTVIRPCYPDESEYIFNVSDPITAVWSSDGSPYSLNTNSILLPFSTFANYQMIKTDPWGCMDTLNLQVQGFNDLIDLELLSDVDTIYQGQSVTLESSIVDLNSYEFIFNNFVYLQEEYYFTCSPEEHTTISLVVTDKNGCTATADRTITVLDPKCDLPYVFIPNTFTPNDDGDNDYFKIEGNFIEKAVISIYNRWGELVFFTENREEYWDGTYKNTPLDADTYAYYIELECIGGEQRTLKGNVSLIR